MQKHALAAIAAFIILGAAASYGPLAPTAHAQAEARLVGSYASVFTGTVFVGSPQDGPFFRVGRVIFDGQGTVFASNVANYNGLVKAESFSGTYTVSQDGTFTISMNNLNLPGLPPGVPNVVSFYGAIGDGGKILKIGLTGIAVAGQQAPNIGNVVTGELIRQ